VANLTAWPIAITDIRQVIISFPAPRQLIMHATGGMTGHCLGKPQRIPMRALQVATGAACLSDEPPPAPADPPFGAADGSSTIVSRRAQIRSLVHQSADAYLHHPQRLLMRPSRHCGEMSRPFQVDHY
jgi:hypothetical protein